MCWRKSSSPTVAAGAAQSKEGWRCQHEAEAVGPGRLESGLAREVDG